MNLLIWLLFNLVSFSFTFSSSFNNHVIRPIDYDEIRGTTEQPVKYWLDQKVNHFDANDNRTYKQLYYYNATYYKPGGPVFLHINGEDAANPIWLRLGQASQVYAKTYNAMFVLLEHRYYGESMPTANLSVDNLKYLTSEQALEDIAHFVKYFIKNMSLENSKWIAFGGSYPGSLAARFRSNYPELVSGAIASSAAMEAVLNLNKFLSTVSQILGTECSAHIREAYADIEQTLLSKDGVAVATISKLFKLCRSLNASDTTEVQYFHHIMQGRIDGDIIFQDLYPQEPRIKTMCDIMSDKKYAKYRAVQRYAIVQRLFEKGNCTYPQYKYLIDYMKKVKATDNAVIQGQRQWTYQTCNEFGYFMTTDREDQPFGHSLPLDYFVKRCADIFGPKFNLTTIRQNIAKTNDHYGTKDTINITNVVFVNHQLDPWKPTYVDHPLNNSTFVIWVNGTGHGRDMILSKPTDSQELKDARLFIEKQIGVFLNST